MKNFIIWLLIAFAFIGSVVYFVFSSEDSLSITYIKFEINPEFIIGINNKDEVKIYNPLNNDAKVLNLNMFNGYKLEETMEIIFSKLKENGYLNVSQMDISVITKSDNKINYYYNIISDVIRKNNYNILLINQPASHEELVAYSNEVSHEIKPNFSNDVFKNIAFDISNYLNNHVNVLISNLNIEELSLNEKIDALTQSDSVGYFEDYELTNYIINNYQLKIKDNSSYDVKFTYDDVGYSFNIELNLIFEYRGYFLKDEISYNTIEEYSFVYKNDDIYAYKNNFYKFN